MIDHELSDPGEVLTLGGDARHPSAENQQSIEALSVQLTSALQPLGLRRRGGGLPHGLSVPLEPIPDWTTKLPRAWELASVRTDMRPVDEVALPARSRGRDRSPCAREVGARHQRLTGSRVITPRIVVLAGALLFYPSPPVAPGAPFCLFAGFCPSSMLDWIGARGDDGDVLCRPGLWPCPADGCDTTRPAGSCAQPAQEVVYRSPVGSVGCLPHKVSYARSGHAVGLSALEVDDGRGLRYLAEGREGALMRFRGERSSGAGWFCARRPETRKGTKLAGMAVATGVCFCALPHVALAPPMGGTLPLNTAEGSSALDTSLEFVDCRRNHAPVPVENSTFCAQLGDPVEFDGTAQDQDGDKLTYHWAQVNTNGDGPIATILDRADPVLAFDAEEEGTYGFELTVSDGCAEETSVIEVATGGTAAFSMENEVIELGETATFEAQCDDQLMYLWSFSDGGSGFGPSFTRVFSRPGVFQAWLTVITAGGQTLQTERTVQVAVDASPTVVGLLLGDIGDGWGMQIFESHDIAWVAGGSKGNATLAVVDISTPSSPELLDEYEFIGHPWQMAASGSLVAIAAKYGGVYLYDASDPASPELLGRFDTYNTDGTAAMGVAFVEVEGDTPYLYVACQTNLKILDVSAPEYPEVVESIAEYANTRLLEASGFVYGGEYAGPSLLVLDARGEAAADPTVDHLATTSLVFDLEVSGNVLAVVERDTAIASLGGALALYDVSSPGEPALKSRMSGAGMKYRTVTLANDMAYALSNTTLVEIEISDLTSPTVNDGVSLGGVGGALRFGDDGRVYAALMDGATLAVVEP